MGMTAAPPGPVRSWLQLVRAPNLFSVPGDVLAGALFTAGLTGAPVPALLLALGALSGVLIYAAGLIDNDRVDYAEDLRERPGRPLPSGRISRKAASLAEALLFALPLGLALSGRLPAAWGSAQLLLVAAVLLYNRVKAAAPRAGFLLMGFCRALNLFAGGTLIWTACAPLPLLAVALCWGGYVAALTVFASHETRRAPGAGRFWVALPVSLLALAAGLPGVEGWTAVAVLAAAAAGTAGVVDALRGCPPGPDPARVPPTVGKLVRLLIPMQALLALAGPADWGVPVALGLLAFWLAARKVGRVFYAS